MYRRTMAALLLSLAVLTAAGALRPSETRAAEAQPAAASDQSGLMFVENVGQFDEGARFQLRSGRGTVWLAVDAIWITILEPATKAHTDDPMGGRYPLLDPSDLPDPADDAPRRGVNVRLSFVGAKPGPTLEPFQPLTTTVSYFMGNDPEKWRPAVPVWGGVRYVSLYPGLDLELSARDGELAPQMVCRAADCPAALENVRLQVDGAEETAVEGGALRITTAVGDFRLPLLQVVDAAGRPVELDGTLTTVVGATVSSPFTPGSSPLPPVPSPKSPDDDPADLLYSTFLGGGDSDLSTGLALDGEGNAYVTGWTYSAEFPTTPGAFDPDHNGSSDAFVARLNADSANLHYATFLGGGGWEGGMSIAIDGTGSAYVAGSTYSWNFPATATAFDTTLDGYRDAFVLRISPTGDVLIYATFLGGSDGDWANALDVDADGNSYVAGFTLSTDYPTTAGAYDETFNGGGDAFVAVLDPIGSELTYSTFLGGTEGEYYYGGLVLDGAGNATLAGETNSADFPTTSGAFDTTLDGNSDAFVVKLNVADSQLSFATFLGGDNWDVATTLVVDAIGSVFVTGATGSTNFPTTPGAFAPALSGSYDGFVAKLNPAGSELSYGSFLGGSLEDAGWAIMVDGSGNAYVTGETKSADFPTTPGAYDTSYNGNQDVFLAALSPAGSDLSYATFLGGSSSDGGMGLAVDVAGSVYVAGTTSSPDFPTTVGASDNTFNGIDDVFVSKLAAKLVYADFDGLPREGPSPLSVTFTNQSGGEFDSCAWDFGDGSSASSCETVVHSYDIVGVYTVTLTVSGTLGTDTEMRPGYITVYEPVAAGFTATPTVGVAPLEVVFENLSAGDFDICLWDFGDGGTSTACVDPVHTYLTAELYSVSLTVSGLGGMDTLTRTDYIGVYEPVAAAFTADPTEGIAPLTVEFTNQSAGDFDACLWAFGDGGASDSCAELAYDYTAAGVYTVSLTVSGPGGTDTLIQPSLITVYEPVTADFAASPTEGIAPLLVSFENLSTGDFDTCAWGFGDDGTSDSCTDPSHEYAAGVYTVTLEVSGPGGTDSETKASYLTVYEPVAADFTAEPTAGTAPLEVQFANVSTGDFETCLWEFGDGGASEQCADPAYVYLAAGTYTVTLTVSGPGGTDTETKAGYITVEAAAYAIFIPVALRPE